MIESVTKFTKESYEAFLQFTICGKELGGFWKPGRLTIAVFMTLVILFLLRNLQISPLISWLVIPAIVIVVLCFVIISCVYFIPKEMVKSTLKKTPRIFETVSTFNFFDEHFVLDQVCENNKSHLEMKYSSLYKIVETENYFFFCPQEHMAYILDKADITRGTVEQLSNLLENALDAKKFKKYKSKNFNSQDKQGVN